MSQCESEHARTSEEPATEVSSSKASLKDVAVSALPNFKPRLARSQKKRLRRLEALEGKRERRREKKLNKKQAKAQTIRTEKEAQEQVNEDGSVSSENSKDGHQNFGKIESKAVIRERCQKGLSVGLKICIDCGLENNMSKKECAKLAQQIGRLYGANRKSLKPAAIHLTSLSSHGCIYTECLRVNSGFEHYQLLRHLESHDTLFQKEELVYLSPDADLPLDTVDMNKVYVIGGLVDETVQNCVSKNRADVNQICIRRLPIVEHMVKANDSTHFSKILTVNQVFEALLLRSEGKTWTEVLAKVVPRRKGYIVKEQLLSDGHSSI